MGPNFHVQIRDGLKTAFVLVKSTRLRVATNAFFPGEPLVLRNLRGNLLVFQKDEEYKKKGVSFYMPRQDLPGSDMPRSRRYRQRRERSAGGNPAF